MSAQPLETLVPSAERRYALDRAHSGDIEGALGRLAMLDTGPRQSSRHRLATMLAVMGPGIFVMVAGNDAGGISTYAEAGQDYGAKLLWLLGGLAVVLLVNQEMAARLGAVTGVGHTRLIRERFGRRWAAFALGDLALLNLFTLVVDFIGVTLGLAYFGVSRYLGVPAAAAVLGLITLGGSYRRFEQVMCALVGLSLVVIPLSALGLVHHAAAMPALVTARAPHPRELVLVIALAGTTVAPWQLFLQQSSLVDKRITSRWIGYSRADTLAGVLLFAASAAAVLGVCAAGFGGSALHGAFVDAGDVASGLGARLGPVAGALFAVLLLNGSVLGAGAVSLSTSYAAGDAFGVKHSLHRRVRDAPVFHGAYVLIVFLAAALVLVPHVPLGLVTTSVQALAGILLPSASVFLLLLCNDKEVLGPWVNPRWLNALATAVVAGLLVLSAMATVTAFAPRLGMRWADRLLGVLLAGAVAAAVTAAVRTRRAPAAAGATAAPAPALGLAPAAAPVPAPGQAPALCPARDELARRLWWTMPCIELLRPPVGTRTRSAGLILLRAYTIVAAVVLVAELVRLGLRR